MPRLLVGVHGRIVLESRGIKICVVLLHSISIAGSIPPALGKLAALQSLPLRGNELTGESSRGISGKNRIK